MKSIKKTMRIRKGLTLIEAAAVLGILAMVVAGALLLFQSASTNQKTSDAASELATIQQSIRSIYSGQSSFTSLAVSDLTTMLPKKMVNGTALKNSFGGAIDVGSALGGSGFYIDFGDIPTEACMKLATMDMGRAVTDVDVATSAGTGQATAGNTAPLDPGTAATSCSAASLVHLTWTISG